MASPTTLSPLERFTAGFDSGPPEECRLWRGAPTPNGYGRLRIGGRRETYAHRFALELHLGRPLEPGEFALHSCDTPLYVNTNPGHVRLGTQVENVADAVERDRMRKPRCRAGHLRMRENTRERIDRRGYRHRACKDCERDRRRARSR